MPSFAQGLLEKLWQPSHFFHALIAQPEESLRREFLTFCKGKGQQQSEVELCILDKPDLRFEDFLQEYLSFSLFEESKVIVWLYPERYLDSLKKHLSLFEGKTRNVVWLMSGSFTSKQIKQLPVFTPFVFAKEKPWERTKRMEAERGKVLQEKGIKLSFEAKRYLFHYLASLQGEDQKEWEKFLLWASPSPSLEQIKALFPPSTLKEDFWELINALFEQDLCRFSSQLKAEMQVQESPFILLSQLRSQLRMALLLCGVEEHHFAMQDFQKLYPYLKGRFLEKRKNQVKRLGATRLHKLLKALFDIEVSLKSEKGDFNKSFERQLLLRVLGE